MAQPSVEGGTPKLKVKKVTMLNVSRAESSRKSSLDGDTGDGSSRKVQLCDPALDTPESLERKMYKQQSGSKTHVSGSKLSKRESLKEKKKSYRSQKKEVAREIMNSASDQSFVLMADWLKVRGTLKGWSKLWCVCKPAMLIIYKSEKMKTGHWVGTILLNTCHLLQRPSKKEGFCFKLFHPLDQSIWATKGPKGETIGAFVQPLPMSYAIFRAPSENQGKCWMDGLELALRCTSLIKRTTSRPNDITNDLSVALSPELSHSLATDLSSTLASDLNSSLADDTEEAVEESEDIVEHFSDDDDHSSMGLSESDFELAEEEKRPQAVPKVEETVYVSNEVEELGQQGDACQTEEVDEENKSLIWTLVKQVRPGMDLSKVVLPTFILEPRSFLDKLTDYYYHADILSEAVQQETALERMKMVVRWYLSGFYKKPKGLKKPYNPIIGETLRCYWFHPKTKSRTFYVAEQISHHPPISAFHVTNRHDGFNINGCILAKSKFYGNSISAILEGVATLTFLERGEDYLMTMPYAHCKGILLGTLTMEMGGKVSIDCPKTGYHCDLDFKLKPFFGNGESANRITGRITMGQEVLCTFEGHWDQQIYIKELTNREKVVFWDPSPETRNKRLTRYTVPIDFQLDNESERLWRYVSAAVIDQDMHAATEEKHKLEEIQRSEAKERYKANAQWVPKWFCLDPATNKWLYKHVDARPWDPMTDCVQYEKDYVIQTQTVHNIPQVWHGPSCLTGRLKAFNRHSALVTDDSYSSDNNAAESDDARCRNTNRKSSPSDQMSSSEASHVNRQAGPSSDQRRSNVSLSTVDRRATTPENFRRQAYNKNSSSNDVVAVDKSSPSKLPTKEEMFKVTNQHNLRASVPSAEVVSLPSNSPSLRVAVNRSSLVNQEVQLLARVAKMQQEMHSVLGEVVVKINQLHQVHQQSIQIRPPTQAEPSGLLVRDWVLVAILLVFQTIAQWFFAKSS
ncbi:oxysterol-binding protein-related protein 8-like isoform X2 [Biomphalaria glabrata]|uniref:Oxysterol-binding protein n=1 Tax=Biomphalaria glabrata TaxID=6526 RepID=A0A9W3BM40_BIOGL|nr:oxysterol-binding protein-related protein 8-like isoform X2 [Biomphalaria glabrata]XP_055900550.1 oxysterol-binding protein-related protein 8-like isoform X2 [Biomphalaria glabrata]XP_055900551.1 oxysterol-binding protein-related protein 8-like isoform X2 [Biomphalaria glabrata]XP_055900552.1 oxysterol-binding protein-related protein 8-like isoform X2 [Biomphalaria glabrata]XP_055900553.1 oxysterol-binding protein-related protein 8-like isoform X2 [Biomphalaria glabrata]